MVDAQPWIVDYILSNPQWSSTSRIVEVGRRLKRNEGHDVPTSVNSATVRVIHDNGYGIIAVFKDQPRQQNSNDTYLDSLDDEDPSEKLTRSALLVIHDYSVHFVFVNPERYYFYMQVDRYNVLDQRVGFVHSRIPNNCMNHPVVLYFAQHLAKGAESSDSETSQHKSSGLSELVDCLSEPNAGATTSIGLDDTDKSVLNARITRSRSRGQSDPSVPETSTITGPPIVCCCLAATDGAAVTDLKPLIEAVFGADGEIDHVERKAEDLVISRQDKKHVDSLQEWRYDYVPSRSATQSPTGQTVPSGWSQESHALRQKPWKGKALVDKSVTQNPSKSKYKRAFTDLNESKQCQEFGIMERSVVVEKTPTKAVCRFKKFGHVYQLDKRPASGEDSKQNSAKQSGSEQGRNIPEKTANNVSDELASFHLESGDSSVTSPQQERSPHQQSTQDTYSRLLAEMGRPSGDTNLTRNPGSESPLGNVKHHPVRSTQNQQSTQSMSQVNPIQLNLSPIPKNGHYSQGDGVLSGSGDILEEARLAAIGESRGKRADLSESRRLERMWGGDRNDEGSGDEKGVRKTRRKSSGISDHQNDKLLQKQVNVESSQKSDDSLFSSSEEKRNSPAEVIEISSTQHSPDVQATGSFDFVQKLSSQTVITISSDSAEGGLTQEQSTRLPDSSGSQAQGSSRSKSTAANSSEENRMPNTPDFLLIQGGQVSSQTSSVGDRQEEVALLSSIEAFLEAKYNSQHETSTPQQAEVPDELLAKVTHYWASLQM